MMIKTILALSLLAQTGFEADDTAASVKLSIAKIQAAMQLSDSEYRLAVVAIG